MLALECSSGSDLSLRLATLEDLDMVFHWRNLPEIVTRALKQESVTWDDHVRWFHKTLADDRSLMLIVTLGSTPVGQVRFDPLNLGNYEISVYLIPQFTGQGLGVRALKKACKQAFEELEAVNFVARIRKDNTHSISAFSKAGFYEVSSEIVGGTKIVNMMLHRRDERNNEATE